MGGACRGIGDCPRPALVSRCSPRIDSKEPSIPLEAFIYTETRYKMLQRSDPEGAARLLEAAQEDVRQRWQIYQQMAAAKPASE